MSKVASKSKSRSLPRWQISRLKSTPAVDIGHPVEAPDADTAIQRAIELFEIAPQHQKRLAARQVTR